MARASREQAEKHREAIEQASSKLFRERGLNGVSVAELMGSAGLTHGGFYGHFSSKDELAALACKRAFEESARRWSRRLERAGGDQHAMRSSLVEPYLTLAHCTNPGDGCAAVALAGDIAREPADKPVRQVYIDGFKHMVDDWMKTVGHADPAERRKLALAQLATLVGAMTIARATEGDALAEDMLAAAREMLLGPLAQ